MKIITALIFILTSTIAVAASNNEPISINITRGTDVLVSSDIIKWSLGVSRDFVIIGGGSSGLGPSEFQGISITRLADSQSPTILNIMTVAPNGVEVIIVRGTLRITLRDAFLSSYSVDGASGKEFPQTENFIVEFKQIMYEVDGAAICWDVVLHAQC
jgi:hypothetical protein